MCRHFRWFLRRSSCRSFRRILYRQPILRWPITFSCKSIACIATTTQPSGIRKHAKRFTGRSVVGTQRDVAAGSGISRAVPTVAWSRSPTRDATDWRWIRRGNSCTSSVVTSREPRSTSTVIRSARPKRFTLSSKAKAVAPSTHGETSTVCTSTRESFALSTRDAEK